MNREPRRIELSPETEAYLTSFEAEAKAGLDDALRDGALAEGEPTTIRERAAALARVLGPERFKRAEAYRRAGMALEGRDERWQVEALIIESTLICSLLGAGKTPEEIAKGENILIWRVS